VKAAAWGGVMSRRPHGDRHPHSDAKAEDDRTARYAGRMVAESSSIAGTLAERYWRAVRGFGDLPLPSELRFHPAVWCRETH